MRLIYLTFGWVVGILIAANSSMRPTLVWVALTIVAMVALWVGRHDNRQKMLTAVVIALTLGGVRFSFIPVSSDIAQYNNIGGLTIEGLVIDEPDARDDRVLLRIQAETVSRIGQTVSSSGIVLVQAPPTTHASYGDRVAATGVLIAPAESDTFSYADYLARGGVYSIMQNTSVQVLESGHGDGFYRTLLDLKARAGEIIARHLPEPQAGLLSGILLGQQNGIAPEIQDAFSKVGASHVVAISGFNMAILSSVILGLLKAVRLPRKWSAVIGIVVIVVYTIFVGANPAVVRAAIMSSLLVIGQTIRRKTFLPASLAFTTLLLSALNPLVLWDISFQLSMFAVLGLMLFSQPLSVNFAKFMHRLFPPSVANPVSTFLGDPLIVTLAVQITTLPLIVLYFGRISLVLFVVNLLIIPVQAQLLILGIAATLMAIILPGIAQLLFWVDMLLLGWTIAVVRLFARLPFTDAEFYVDPRIITAYFIVLIGGAMLRATRPTWAVQFVRVIRGRAVVTATAFSGIAIFLLSGAIYLSQPDGYLHLWLPDVGHSNAALIQTPGGAQMLVDGGHFPSRLLTAIGDHFPFNDREIEVLVITQPDEWDTSALTAVLARYEVGIVITNGQPNLSEGYQQLQDASSSSEVINVRAGYTLDVDDGVRLEVMNPSQQPELSDSLDENALVLRLTFGEASILLTGDLSPDGQAALLEGGSWPLATVLQLPQHGTIRSLDHDFLAAVQPQVVIFQSDRANRRGDPDLDTLGRLGDIPIFRTDLGGSIHLWTDGKQLWVEQDGQK